MSKYILANPVIDPETQKQMQETKKIADALVADIMRRISNYEVSLIYARMEMDNVNAEDALELYVLHNDRLCFKPGWPFNARLYLRDEAPPIIYPPRD